MKKIIIEMIFNDAEGLIQHSQEAFHDTFKDDVDYKESNVAITSDIPNTNENGFFTGDESRLTVDFTTAINKKDVAYKTIEALGAQLKSVPGVLGNILDPDKGDAE